jgi:3-hydroxyacyl-[acyl-carrier-protein] dehydratase
MLIKELYTTQSFQKEGEGTTAHINLNPEHEIFKGHFPGKPVMPGVCMIQIIKELTERTLGKDLFLSTTSNIKFMAIINPEIDSALVINIDHIEEPDIVKIRSTASFGDTLALKLNATFKIME